MNIPERALIIRKPWSDHILNQEKTWELRGKKTNIRGDIALIEGGSGKIVGIFNLENCSESLTREERVEAFQNGKILECEIDEDMYDNVYAWKLKNIVRFETPVNYKHPSGAVIWVTLTELDKQNIQTELEKIEIKKTLEKTKENGYSL